MRAKTISWALKLVLAPHEMNDIGVTDELLSPDIKALEHDCSRRNKVQGHLRFKKAFD